jgi:SNF2 family DNA or RNA helicase
VSRSATNSISGGGGRNNDRSDTVMMAAARSFLHCVAWQRVVVDEAHMICNRNTKRFRSIDALLCRYRWCLTATPIGNSKKELKSLLTWVSGTNRQGIREPDRVAAVEAAMNMGASSVASIHLAVLRRTKLIPESPSNNKGGVKEGKRSQAGAGVLIGRDEHDSLSQESGHDDDVVGTSTLPKLREITKRLQLRSDSLESSVYHALLRHTRVWLKTHSETLSPKDRLHAFELVLRLRQAATHPGLVLRAAEDSKSKRLRKVLSKVLDDADANSALDDFENDFMRPRESAKVRALMKMCKKWCMLGEKFVIFSAWTSMLDIVSAELKRKRFKVERFDGKMNGKKRARALARCRSNFSQGLLVSIKAGGTGLNLQIFQHAVILEPCYNPSVEKQAIGRIHRLGQRHDEVTVTRFLVERTIEEDMVALQERKLLEATDALEWRWRGAVVDNSAASAAENDTKNDTTNMISEALVQALLSDSR